MSSLIDKLMGRPHHNKNDATHSTTTDSTTTTTNTNSNLNAYANPTDNSMGGVLGNNRSGYNSTGLHNTNNIASGNMHTGMGLSGADSTYVNNTTSTTATDLNANRTLDTTMRDETMTNNTTGAVITRSEERLAVGKETVDTGSVALNKYVTTEHVEQAVPIVREHVTIEREPITTSDAAMLNPTIAEARIQVDTTAERAVAMKETVPIEKIRLNKVREHTEDLVEADLRKEHVDVINNTSEKVLGTTTGLNAEKSLNNNMGTMDTRTNMVGNDLNRKV